MHTAGGLFFVLCYADAESGKAELATSRAFLFYENAQAYAATLSPRLAPFIVKKVMVHNAREAAGNDNNGSNEEIVETLGNKRSNELF